MSPPTCAGVWHFPKSDSFQLRRSSALSGGFVGQVSAGQASVGAYNTRLCLIRRPRRQASTSPACTGALQSRRIARRPRLSSRAGLAADGWWNGRERTFSVINPIRRARPAHRGIPRSLLSERQVENAGRDGLVTGREEVPVRLYGGAWVELLEWVLFQEGHARVASGGAHPAVVLSRLNSVATTLAPAKSLGMSARRPRPTSPPGRGLQDLRLGLS